MKNKKNDNEINRLVKKEYLRAKLKTAVIQFGIVTGIITVINLFDV